MRRYASRSTKQKLPVGGGDSVVRVRDLGGRIGERQFAEHERHERALRKAVDDLPGRIAQHAGLVPLRLMDGAAQIAGLVHGVGIGKQQPAPARMLRGCPDGVCLAGPAGFQFLGLHHGYAGKAARDLGCLVGGVVVDDDEFPVAAELEDVFRLAGERLKAGRQGFLLVARGNDDGELDQLRRFRLGKHGAGERFAGVFAPVRWAFPARRLIGEAQNGLPSSFS